MPRGSVAMLGITAIEEEVHATEGELSLSPRPWMPMGGARCRHRIRDVNLSVKLSLLILSLLIVPPAVTHNNTPLTVTSRTALGKKWNCSTLLRTAGRR
jgi:hypothetical protein